MLIMVKGKLKGSELKTELQVLSEMQDCRKVASDSITIAEICTNVVSIGGKR